MDEEMREALEAAREAIREGGTVIFPTETAYGIAADALDPEAVENVYEMKQRPREKKLTVIAHDLEQVREHAELSREEERIIEELMPGPLTLVVDRKEHVPDVLNEKFVFRIPGSEVARELARETVITATSANLSGQETSYTVGDIDPGIREKAGYVIDAGELEPSPTSTIAEVVDGEVAVHREGPIKKEDIQKVLQG